MWNGSSSSHRLRSGCRWAEVGRRARCTASYVVEVAVPLTVSLVLSDSSSIEPRGRSVSKKLSPLRRSANHHSASTPSRPPCPQPMQPSTQPRQSTPRRSARSSPWPRRRTTNMSPSVFRAPRGLASGEASVARRLMHLSRVRGRRIDGSRWAGRRREEDGECHHGFSLAYALSSPLSVSTADRC